MNIFGRKRQKKTGTQNEQVMFCKNCGHKISAGGRFCPACGTENSRPVQTPERATKGPGGYWRSLSAIKCRRSKGYYVGVVGLIGLLIIGVFFFTRSNDGTDHMKNIHPKKASSIDKKTYKDLGFSKKQIKELEDVYERAYIDEMKALDPYILAYMESYDEYGDIKEGFQDMVGVTEGFYQAVNAYDPDLKNAIAEEAGQRYGDGPLESHLLEQGVGMVLSDSKFGEDLRSGMEAVGLGILQYFAIQERKEELAARHDLMIPIAIEEDYALVRSSGTVVQMLEQLERNSGYVIADKALQERSQVIESSNTATVEDHWSEDISEVFKAYKTTENYEGRSDALKEKKSEWDEHLYQWKKDFLVQIGIEDEDMQHDLIWFGRDRDDESMILGYFGISDEEYEGLKEKYDTDDINDIIEKTQGDDAWDGYDAYIEEQEMEQGEIYGRYIYSIIDDEGKVYGSFLVPNGELNASINADGMCSLWEDELNDDCRAHVIIDKTGKKLFQNDKEELSDGSRRVYYRVTPSGNVLRKTLTSDYEHGDYQILEFVEPDGTSKKLLEGEFINLSNKAVENEGYSMDPSVVFDRATKNYCCDHYGYECGYNGEADQSTAGVIDMERGELITYDEYDKIMRAEEKTKQGAEVDMKEAGVEIENDLKGIRLNEQYILCDDTIYDDLGKVVKKLTDGRGVKEILYVDSQYWVVTESEWYHILDDDLEEVLKPVEIPKNAKYCLTRYGLLVTGYIEDQSGEQQGYTCLYDDEGRSTKLSDRQVDLDENSFMIDGGEGVGWISLRTKEPILIATPERPISLILH